MLPAVNCKAAGLFTALHLLFLHNTRLRQNKHDPSQHGVRKIPRKACSEIITKQSIPDCCNCNLHL